MNLSGVPASLRGWAISLNNRVNQVESQVQRLTQNASYILSQLQRPVVDYRAGRISTNSPTPILEEGDSAFFYPVSSGPIVQVNSVSGLAKISLNAIAIIKPNAVSGGVSGRYDLGMGFSVVGAPNQPADYTPIRAGNYEGWAIQEVELGSSDAPAVVGREYKFHINSTQYATIPVGQHYVRSEYYLAGVGSSAQVSFANRTLVVEPI